jgi:hypothetical protein
MTESDFIIYCINGDLINLKKFSLDATFIALFIITL